MGNGLESNRKVDLLVALRSMVADVARSANEVGTRPEGMVVELRFSFEEDSERGLRPIVFLGEQPADYDVHRLRLILGPHPKHVVETAMRSSTPPPPVTPPPSVLPESMRKAPRIVIPSNPSLKLRKAGSSPPPTRHPGDEAPVPRAEVDLNPGQLLPVVESTHKEGGPREDLGERFVVFDHQWYHGKQRSFISHDTDEFPDDDMRDSTDIHEFPIDDLDD